jgi:Protein of unknown function (DUF2997).
MTSITIIVKPDGKTVVETTGYYGTSCKDASKFIEQALGQRQTETIKPEYYSTTNNMSEQAEGNP